MPRQAHIEVAAAVIVGPDNQILLSLRSPDAHQGGKWEFPGGKFETNETPHQALIRELKEELDINVLEASEYLHLSHDYAEKSVTLHVFKVTDFSGEPHGMEGQEVRWFSVAELEALEFPDANYPILEKIKQDIAG